MKVHADEQFPADMIFLGSSIEDESCCIDTANLDGETNLKVRKVPDAISDMYTKELLKSRDEADKRISMDALIPLRHEDIASIFTKECG